jgi:glutathione-regulated potassium-efflux system protein KefB
MNEPAAAAFHLREGVLLLGAALAFVLLFRRLGLGATLGFLVAGALIGPHGLDLVGGAAQKLHIAEFGIVLLLFLVGLELNPARLLRLKHDIFGLGTAQVLACGVALTAMIYAVAGFSPGAALALGLPLALSSTAQVLPMLRGTGRLNTPYGERAFSILLFQDLSIVPLITVIAALSRAPVDPSAPPGWLLAVYTVLAVGGLVLAGRFILNPLFRLIGGLGERELFVAAGLFTVLMAAAVMESLHLSPALGAFVAGVMLADSPYRHELETDVEPFRAILLGLFFLAVGMMLDLQAIAARPIFVIGLALALVAIKAGIIFGLARLFGSGKREAMALGLLLSQGGEFGFVLFAQAQAAQLIRPEAASLFGAIVTLSMVTTPFLMMIARRYVRPAQDKAVRDGPDGVGTANVILVGYGRFGQTVAQMLAAKGVALTLIDSKARQIDLSNEFGVKVYFGDGTRIELLRQAGAEEARAILFCIDGSDLGPAQLQPIMEAFPQAAVLARVFDRRQLLALNHLELSGTVREIFESAVTMGRQALETLGFSEQAVAWVEEEYRRRDLDRLDRQASSGDLHAGDDIMFRPGRALAKEGLAHETE